MRRYLFVLVLAGCQGDPLSDSEHIAGWANAASALGVFTVGYDSIAFADGELEFADPACPVTSDDGTTAVIAGDCRDETGKSWFGTATLVRGEAGARLVTLDGYGNDGLGAPVLDTGTFEVRRLVENSHSFEVEVTRDGGIDTTIDYRGTVEGDYDGPTVWNGAGQIRREGVVINSGSVEAETVDQLRDNNICPGEGILGTTTLVSDAHSVVITYDGQTDCDDNDAARWSRDGQDQGTIDGVACAASGRGGAGAAAVLVLVCAVITRRRRAG